MAKITVSRLDLDCLRGEGYLSREGYLVALAQDIEEALRLENPTLTLPGPDGEPNVEVPQEEWLD